MEDMPHEIIIEGIERVAHGLEKLTILVIGMQQTMVAKFEAIERRLGSLEERVEKLEFIMARMQAELEPIKHELKGVHKVLDGFGNRITHLERKTQYL
jgi:hypothetical protein